MNSLPSPQLLLIDVSQEISKKKDKASSVITVKCRLAGFPHRLFHYNSFVLFLIPL
jgi:hypothetical protein